MLNLLAEMPSANTERARQFLRENGGDRPLNEDIPRLKVIGGITLASA